MIPIDPQQFKKIIKDGIPAGTILPNPGGGNTTIKKYDVSRICYKRGKSPIYIDFNHDSTEITRFFKSTSNFAPL
jgi:hypothetical protein